MAKSILTRDAEDAYNRIDRAIKSLDSSHYEDVHKDAYASYKKCLNLLKGYISTATSFDRYIKKCRGINVHYSEQYVESPIIRD